MTRRIVRAILSPTVLIAAALVFLAFYTNVPTKLTADDRRVFASMGVRPEVTFRTFDEEIAAIRLVQADVFRRAPLGEGIAENESREPADLMERVRHGLCYDRSRAFDKAFNYMGFESRHIYLLYREDRGFLSALFHRGQPSHAVTEVKTSRGWLMVDSNTPWIAVTKGGEPVDADNVWKRFSEFENAPKYLRGPWWAIRGLYSRKGSLYSRVTLMPELNWPDFLRWVF